MPDGVGPGEGYELVAIGMSGIVGTRPLKRLFYMKSKCPKRPDPEGCGIGGLTRWWLFG